MISHCFQDDPNGDPVPFLVAFAGLPIVFTSAVCLNYLRSREFVPDLLSPLYLNEIFFMLNPHEGRVRYLLIDHESLDGLEKIANTDEGVEAIAEHLNVEKFCSNLRGIEYLDYRTSLIIDHINKYVLLHPTKDMRLKNAKYRIFLQRHIPPALKVTY